MKPLLIPAIIYFLTTSWYLFIETKLPYFPYQNLLSYTPNHIIQSIMMVVLSIGLLFGKSKIIYSFIILSFVDLGVLIYTIQKEQMQLLSEGLQHVAFSTIIVGIIIQSSVQNNKQVADQQNKKKKKRKVKKLVEVEEEIEEEEIYKEVKTKENDGKKNIEEVQQQQQQQQQSSKKNKKKQ